MRRPDIQGIPRETVGYAHIAFALGSKEAVDALTDRLKAARRRSADDRGRLL